MATALGVYKVLHAYVYQNISQTYLTRQNENDETRQILRRQ
jgi:hypothetical protein